MPDCPLGALVLGVAATLKWAPGDMMMMALFGAAQAAKKFLRPIRASAVKAISLSGSEPVILS